MAVIRVLSTNGFNSNDLFGPETSSANSAVLPPAPSQEITFGFGGSYGLAAVASLVVRFNSRPDLNAYDGSYSLVTATRADNTQLASIVYNTPVPISWSSNGEMLSDPQLFRGPNPNLPNIMLAGSDDIRGNAGADILFGYGGNDFLDGGEGADALHGGAGDDRYRVDHASDVIREDAGGGLDTVQAFLNHTLAPNVENLILEGGNTGGGNAEHNRIDGHGANSRLNGFAGNDLIFGYGGADILDGGQDADRMHGGAGDDSYVVEHGGDVVVENANEGFDTISTFIDHTLEDNVENMIMEGGTFGTGNSLNNRIDGNGGSNVLSGRGGDDQLLGFGGDDTLEGGEANDTLDGGQDADTMRGGAGDDLYVLDHGRDVVVENTSNGTDTIVTFIDHTIEDNVEHMILGGGVIGTGNGLANRIDGNSANNTLSGRGGADQLLGFSGDDTLEGGDGADTLDGGRDADTMRGGAGDDRYVLDHGRDIVVENASEGIDTIIAFIDHTIEDNVENMILESGNVGTGNAENNIIDGHGGNNILNGRAGSDRLNGYGGDDILDGGLGADVMAGGLGNDRYTVDNSGDGVFENSGAGIDTIVSFIDHTIEDNVENMNLQSGVFGTGNALANTIDGNSAANVLRGLGGKDVLNGLGGNDTLEGGNDDDRFVFTNGTGNDTILDMQGGVSAGDVIDIRAFGFASFNAVMAATTDVSGGARIQLDGDDSVFVQNMTKAQFDSNDFLLA